jgi:hypothetical protein
MRDKSNMMKWFYQWFAGGWQGLASDGLRLALPPFIFYPQGFLLSTFFIHELHELKIDAVKRKFGIANDTNFFLIFIET